MTNHGQKVLDSRQATYGDRVANMENAAMMVQGYLNGVQQRQDTSLTGADFAMIMALYKAYRFAVTPEYQDNIDDIEGYLKIARECMGDSLVEATTAEEFQQKIAGARAVSMAMHPAGSQSAEAAAEATAMDRYINTHRVEVPKPEEMSEDEIESETIARERRIWGKTGGTSA